MRTLVGFSVFTMIGICLFGGYLIFQMVNQKYFLTASVILYTVAVLFGWSLVVNLSPVAVLRGAARMAGIFVGEQVQDPVGNP